MFFSDWKSVLCLGVLFLALSSCQKQKKPAQVVNPVPKYTKSKTARLSVELALLEAASFPNRQKGDRESLFRQFGMTPREYLDSLEYFRKSPQVAKEFEESRIWLLGTLHPDSLAKKAKK